MQGKIIRLVQKTTCIFFNTSSITQLVFLNTEVTSVLLHGKNLRKQKSSSEFRIHFKDCLHHPMWQHFPAQPCSALPQTATSLSWWAGLRYEEICQVRLTCPQAGKLKTRWWDHPGPSGLSHQPLPGFQLVSLTAAEGVQIRGLWF